MRSIQVLPKSDMLTLAALFLCVQPVVVRSSTSVTSRFEELQERTTRAEPKVSTFRKAYDQKVLETLTPSITEATDKVKVLRS